MGSRPKVIRLSGSSPPPDLESEEEPPEKKQQKKPEPSSLIGGIVEKGFSTSRSNKVSAPQPKVTPFPVARHRSDGPYWAPSSRMPLNSTTGKNAEEESGTALADFAEPLRRKDRTSKVTSQWRINRRPPSSDSSIDASLDTLSAETPSCLISTVDAGERHPVQEDRSTLELVEASGSGAGSGKMKADDTLMFEVACEDPSGRSLGKAQESSGEQVAGARENTVTEKGPKRDSGSLRGISSLGSTERVAEEIDQETRKTVMSMSADEVAEAQAELSEKLRPELLEMLRRRGLDKERKRSAETRGTVVSRIAEEVGARMKEEAETSSRRPSRNLYENEVCTTSEIGESLIRQSSIAQAESVTAQSSSSLSAAEGEVLPNGEPSDSTVQPKVVPPDFWTLRVEAVRSMRFDIEGNVLFFEPAVEQSKSGPTGSADYAWVRNQENAFSVVERDMLRTEGDPAGSGYTLKEAINLVRSTVPGQRAVALRLIAAVLGKALQGLQIQQSEPVSFADLKEVVDWQAVWAYALGPEAELVLTLRLALDDGHSTVVSACARALQTLLSYSANESFFDSLEGLWPGDKVVYTAPIFRRKTKHDEGFIGSGRWKYNVKRSEMFPFSGTSAKEQVEEEGTDTVGDDGHVANKDVAAGLLRMGILPRLRYILEVDELIVADDALLCVLISLARHSPAAAAAVMGCPRLISTILRRFILKDGDRSQETWSSQLKAIRLLKVLSQASKSNCREFVKYGVLEALLRPLSQKAYDEFPGTQELLRGFYSTTIETIRFWRICLSYRMGLSFFTDCYPTLCVWLLPLCEEEILEGGPDATFMLAVEAYSLLENIARTLPVLHDNLSPTVALAVQLDGTRWSWSVAMTMLNTALKWLSPDRIFAVHVLLERFLNGKGDQVDNGIPLRTRVRKVLGVLGSLFHFLATVSEKIVSEEQLERGLTDRSSTSLPWLPTFVPHLGLAIARSGLLNATRDESQINLHNGELEKTYTLLDFMFYCLSKRDNDSMLAAVNCQHAFVRVSSIVDKLISINRPKGVTGQADQPMAHAILDQGLIISAEDGLKRWMTVTGKTMTSRCSLVEMSSRGGPAPGVGVGWGALRGGVFAKDVMVAQASARLNLHLLLVLSVMSPSTSSEFPETHLEGDALRGPGRPQCQELFCDPLWRISTGLALAVLATPPNMELIERGCSMTIFSPACLSLLIEKVESRLSNWRTEDPERLNNGYGRGYTVLESAHLSKVLAHHFKTFWLAIKRKKHQDNGESRVLSGKAIGSVNSKLPTVHEESSAEVDDITPQSLVEEFAGQRLPLPSHWFLCPLVTDVAREMAAESGSKVDELEEVVTSGLVFFLGLELLKADISPLGPVIPLVRKIHSLSCVFVTGGDVFLRPLAGHVIGALQDGLGSQLEEERRIAIQQNRSEMDKEIGIRVEQEESEVHGDHSATATEIITPVTSGYPSGETLKDLRLDFEGIIDPSYVTYAETVAEQFVSSSYGDLVFGRQVALHFWTSVPVSIRLATWRVLADARVLDLLPPLSQCCGQPLSYLHPVETDQKMLEAYVSAWVCGALDKAATRNSLPFRLALHHLCGFIFEKKGVQGGEDLLMQKKQLRTLVRSTLRRSDRQAMLIRLLVGSTLDQTSVDVKEQVRTRSAFLEEACEGDVMLLAEVQRVRNML